MPLATVWPVIMSRYCIKKEPDDLSSDSFKKMAALALPLGIAVLFCLKMALCCVMRHNPALMWHCHTTLGLFPIPCIALILKQKQFFSVCADGTA